MESFHIQSSSANECAQSFIFHPDDLADIPHPDDFCGKPENSQEVIDLPLPPGTSGDDFTIPLQFKSQTIKNTNNFPPAQHNENFEKSSNVDPGLMSESFNILPLNADCLQKPSPEASEPDCDIMTKPMDLVDDSKYSPSKMDSDEDNQDFVTTKPKVLGKEQAKKRLLAFSLTKQPSTAVKKQNKAVTPAKNKEKPPNPNKGTNLQEQFRATISAIEEEKKKMFQNMPNYLLQEMNDLAKSSYSLSSPSLQLLEKLKSEHSDARNKSSSSKSGRSSTKPQESRGRKSSGKNRSRSISPSKSKKRRRSRSKRRSRSNSKRSRSRRSHSRSRSRRSRSHSKRRREDKNYKLYNKETQSVPKKKLHEDWSSYKAAGLINENNSKNDSNPWQTEQRLRSPNSRTELKPIFNYLNKGCNVMTSFQARPADPNSSSPPLFSEKTIKFTRTKPILCWAENPAHAKEFYMSKQMLLENCDQATASILLAITENKNIDSLDLQFEPPQIKSRPWFPRYDYLLTNKSKGVESSESYFCQKSLDVGTIFDKEQSETAKNKDISSIKEDAKKRRTSLERKISLVNDEYLSDEEHTVKEMIVGEVKVQLDLDKNRVKVRSKWDSDYEGENSEKESVSRRGESKSISALKVQTDVPPSDVKEKVISGFDFRPDQEKAFVPTEQKKVASANLSSLTVTPVESPMVTSKSGVDTENLVSEYEEFLKMVSVDSSDVFANQKEKMPPETTPKSDKQKTKRADKTGEDPRKSPKLGLTDWDQESDHDEKPPAKKMQFSSAGSHDEFFVLKEENFDAKKEEKSKRKLQKKSEKSKDSKAKTSRKSSKAKKKKYDSYSEDSSSESNDSDSGDSDSDDSEPSRKKKKKKYLKTKKKSKETSSSDSDSDSDDSKTQKKKSKQNKGGKKKDSSSESDEPQNSLLKQLDFKKQLIMKKMEEVDYVDDKEVKKKQKENQARRKETDSSEDTDLEKYIKSGKKKKAEVKAEKEKKKYKAGIKKSKLLGKAKKFRKSASSSESETSEDSVKKKKSKKSEKKKKDTSEESSSDRREKKSSRSKPSGKSSKKSKKSRRDSSSSGSDSDDSSKDQKSEKKKEEPKSDGEKLVGATDSNFKDDLLLNDSDFKHGKPIAWEMKKLWKKPDDQRQKKKEDDDWEASSSTEESQKGCKSRESSWDDEVKPQMCRTKAAEDSRESSLNKKQTVGSSQDAPELTNQHSSGTLKGSLSVFSFNENSFCSFGQELSRDFFLTELNYSNSGNPSGNDNLKASTIEPRPFQSVSRDGEAKKVAHSELYSPGHSDSEASDMDIEKPEKTTANFISENRSKEEVYDPLNCDSDGSGENNKVELSAIPLPRASDILLPGEARNFPNLTVNSSSNLESDGLKNLARDSDKPEMKFSSVTPPLKPNFSCCDFTPVASSLSPFNDGKNTPNKRQLMSVKGQPKLISKAASVFQDESDEENIEPSTKGKTSESAQSEPSGETKCKETDDGLAEDKSKDESSKWKGEILSKSRERSEEKSGKRKRSRSRERRSHSKSSSKKESSPISQNKTKAPDAAREKREIRSDSFEIEPLKSSIESNGLSGLVQPIPVLTSLEPPPDPLWTRSLIPDCEFPHASDNLIDNGESFDIYPSEESTYRHRSYVKDDFVDQDEGSLEKLKDQRTKRESRSTRSRSFSPKPKLRSKSPEKRRSPRNRNSRRKSASPKRKEKSPFSPKRRSPKRKSPSRRYKKGSRSPDKRRKSRSRSPRKRRGSPSRRSPSASPRKYRSPKHLDESPRRRDSSATAFSPKESFSPRKEAPYSYPYPVHNRIPVIGSSASVDDADRELSPLAVESPMFENSVNFPRHMPDPSAHEPDMYGSFYEGEYSEEFGMSSYPEEVSVNNLITVKNHDLEKATPSERLSLDQRIELELGVPMSAGSQAPSDQYQVCPQFQDANYFQNSCNCDNANVGNDNFYQNQNVQMNDFNGQYFNGHQQQSNYRPFQQYPNSQPAQNSVLQVGNIVEVVPTSQRPPPPLAPSKTAPQIMQVGNVLQVVPSQKPVTQNYSDGSPIVKPHKATAVVAPSSVVPTPNAEAILSPLIKAIQLEREKRRKEKEKRKAEREARRKARQLRREAKLMLVNEKLKKSVQNEGLMLGQEVEDDELLDGLDVPSPPIPVEIITVSSPNALPPAGKGILITAGFMPKPPSEKKEVKFADGVCPGEGTSTSGGEEIASPPPKPKLPKEKRFKKRKTKVKKKVKVQIIRQIIQEEDDDEDELSPPPPPPGDPPPVFFARFPFAGDAQFPVYQTQTTTTTLTTIQYPNASFE